MREANMSKMLIVDDDQDARESLARALKQYRLAVDIFLAADVKSAMELAGKEDLDLAIVDLCLDLKQGVESGFELIKALKQNKKNIKIIVLTGHSSVAHGVRALQLGASSFLEKPANIEHLIALCQDALSQVAILKSLEELKVDRQQLEVEKIFVGNSDAVKKLRSEVLYAVSHNQPVYIYGETGTGKGLCAQSIHNLAIHNSGTAKNRFIRYQPSLAAAAVAASELFGHLKGSFTGALEEREGLLKRADGGTLFLDEVDELSLDLQVSLLGVLQDKHFRALGSDKEIKSDFRLISASNRPIEESFNLGKLRKDFYHRCAHCKIELPPLRNRKQDILPIAEDQLKKLVEREGLEVFDIASSAKEALQSYEWPGNIRELLATVESAVYRARFNGHDIIQVEDLDFSIAASKNKSDSRTLYDKVDEYRKQLCLEALEAAGQNQVQASKNLGIDRATLRRILSK